MEKEQRAWGSPRIEIQKFVPQEYVAACKPLNFVLDDGVKKVNIADLPKKTDYPQTPELVSWDQSQITWTLEGLITNENIYKDKKADGTLHFNNYTIGTGKYTDETGEHEFKVTILNLVYWNYIRHDNETQQDIYGWTECNCSYVIGGISAS